MNMVNAHLKKDVLTNANDPRYTMSYTPTDVLPIDILFQGGIPRGRFIEIYGDYSTLKSYIGLMAIAEHQRRGMTCAVVDNEHSFDGAWARSCGVNTDDLLMIWPDTGEEAFDAMETLIRGGIDCVLFDSVAAMTPQAEQEKRLHGENLQPARIAMLMSAGLRRITTANKNTSIIFINQLRTNIGITFGSSEALPGGKALPYYATYRLNIRKTGKETRDRRVHDGSEWKNTKETIGQKFKAELTKSKLSKPFSEEWFTWSLLTGSIDMVGYLISQGLEHGIITLNGSTWAHVTSGTKVVGRDKFQKRLASDPDLVAEIENEVRELRGLAQVDRATVRNQVTAKARTRGHRALAAKKVSALKRK